MPTVGQGLDNEPQELVGDSKANSSLASHLLPLRGRLFLTSPSHVTHHFLHLSGVRWQWVSWTSMTQPAALIALEGGMVMTSEGSLGERKVHTSSEEQSGSKPSVHRRKKICPDV